VEICYFCSAWWALIYIICSFSLAGCYCWHKP
jgi:hypothetical protein